MSNGQTRESFPWNKKTYFTATFVPVRLTDFCQQYIYEIFDASASTNFKIRSTEYLKLNFFTLFKSLQQHEQEKVKIILLEVLDRDVSHVVPQVELVQHQDEEQNSDDHEGNEQNLKINFCLEWWKLIKVKKRLQLNTHTGFGYNDTTK